MKTVYCTNMPFAKEAFSTLGDVLGRDGRTITPDDVRDAEILATRSTIKINAALLDGSAVKFAGTATIGTDHMDIPYLESHGIRWCAAPGCNANSVSEYVTTALLCLASRHNITLEGKTIGVVGVGNVGTKVVEKALTLGLSVLPNDPPRQKSEIGNRKSEIRFVELPQVLDEADIVTFHVPLTKSGDDKTYHMADTEFFERLKPGCIFINSARGGVVDTAALLVAMDKGIVSHAIMDTWEGEPACRPDLLERVDIGTPHIAGHSFEGKVYGTVMVYEEACRFLGTEPTWKVNDLLPEPIVPHLEVDAAGRSDEDVLWELVHRVYEIEKDDGALRGPSEDRPGHFDSLRKNYPIRREFRFTRVTLLNATNKLRAKTAGLGFSLST